MAVGGGIGEGPEPPNVVTRLDVGADGDAGALTVELVEVGPANPRTPGRHRMPATLPAWLPDPAIVQAWLRRWWISVVSAVLILVTAVTVAVVFLTRDADRPAAPDPAGAVPAATDPGPESTEPAPAPTSAAPASPSGPAASRTPAAGPIERIAAVAVTAQQLIESGDLDERAGREILRTLATITTSVRNGRIERAVDRLRDLDERLGELREDGKLSRSGFAALDVIQPIIASLA
ncbi:hypothetical protein RB614_12725 [Phytohabitans sp. ZYX-F-186]|uniref:Uncharacterized protein n=1 Tax=Phytohabitans maris TaxID=3071409 RepID=A0ABU0ZEA8_9ACTN|nr:hypothetical protein [Phytohabitans sp. ZYX-F-186]MDQ7905389.1 hypothetical protein [Phytohabitans sp. ZYX-F-186]